MIRTDIIEQAIICLEKRFKPDGELIEIVRPFLEFEPNAYIRKIRKIFATDLELATLSLEFDEMVQLQLCKGLGLTDQIKKLIQLINASKYDNVLSILCRVNACTPQSADVERAVKANNLFKTAFRNRLNLDTENCYMYIYHNMPPLEMWSPKKAIVIWMNAKDRRQHVDLIQKETARNRPYFKGIFKLAENQPDEDDEDDDLMQ